MGRLPASNDFTDNIKLAIIPPPGNDPATNVLVLLHGLGDNHLSFARLGEQMRLPETACISLQAPHPLLDLPGFHWGDDIIFDSTSGGLDADAGFKRSRDLLHNVVDDVLVAKCGYRHRELLLFGFGQGGMSALSIAAHLHQLHEGSQPTEFGGVISIGAALSSDSPSSCEPKCRTPVLVCAGSDGSSVTSASEVKLKRIFDFVEIKRYRRSGDGMPSNRDEMMPIMQFFSRRLKSNKGVPKGSVEIS